jgi:hypothetical protein
MSMPYLSSDESLILSTQNIRIDNRSLDLMLTSRRLILIDNSVNPFHLRTIPLDSIIAVVAGMDVKGDPVFTLSHMDPSGSGAPQPMDFIFVQQKGKPRAKECNDWATTLNIHAAGARNVALSSGTLPYDPVKTIQPRMSATYMIETFSPRKPVIEGYPVRAGPVITPVSTKASVGGGIPAGIDEPAPLKNIEMVEPFDSPMFSPQEPEKTDMPDKEEPASLQQAIAYGPSENQIIADAEEPVSSPQVIASGPSENQIISDAEEPVSHQPAIASGPSENQIIADVEEPVSSPQVIASGPSENQIISDAEEPVSHQPAIASGTDEKPAISDAAHVWADAVRTAITPTPVIPLTLSSEVIPERNTIDDKTKADHIITTQKEPVAEINKDVHPTDGIVTTGSVDDESVEPPGPKADPVPVAIYPLAPKISKTPTVLIAAIVIIILLVLGVVVIGQFNRLNSGDTLPPVVVSIVTIQPTPTPIPTLVPSDGVWVRIDYPGNFIGEVGNHELMHPVSGSGVRIYKILWNDRIVKASAQKQENSGETLTVEVYKNGILIKRSSTRAPMGSVDILIDPITGQPPGIRQGDVP